MIERDDELVALVQRACEQPDYAIDTEFHRERTYYPKLALVQLAVGDEIVLIDPLAVDITLLAPLLTDGGTAILHAADQDLDVMAHAVGAIPHRIFDTQVAAGFVGMSTPSLTSLVERVVGVRLPKGDRLTDWLRRPLEAGQLTYAAADVEHLHVLRDVLTSQMEERGRVTWMEDECEVLRTRPRGARDPELAWLRIKEARHLRGPARGVARSLAAWRERRAASLDQPVRSVLADLALVGVAQRQPTTTDDLRKVRGVDDRHLRGGVAEEILDAVRAGIEAGAPQSTPRDRATLDPALRPAVALVAAWASQRAHDLALDPAILATRGDIEAVLRGDADARLAHGWRAEALGQHIAALVGGDAALAFGAGGDLVLEARSGRAL